MKNVIFLSLCIYNLEVLTYNQMKPFIEMLTRSLIILALFLNFAWLPLIEPGNARDWVEAGSDVMQSTQTQLNMPTSVWNATSEKVRLSSCRSVHFVRDRVRKCMWPDRLGWLDDVMETSRWQVFAGL